MNRVKTLFFIATIVIIAVVTWYLQKEPRDPLICMYTLICSLFLLAILFQFPNADFLFLNDLTQKQNEKSNKKINGGWDIEIKELVNAHHEVDDYVQAKTRHHDTLTLINDTKKGMYIGFFVYGLVLLGGMYSSYLVKHHFKNYDPETLSIYKDVISLLYIGLAFVYLVYYFSPVNMQRFKNETMLKE